MKTEAADGIVPMNEVVEGLDIAWLYITPGLR